MGKGEVAELCFTVNTSVLLNYNKSIIPFKLSLV